jgi:hypothetical protein
MLAVSYWNVPDRSAGIETFKLAELEARVSGSCRKSLKLFWALFIIIGRLKQKQKQLSEAATGNRDRKSKI